MSRRRIRIAALALIGVATATAVLGKPDITTLKEQPITVSARSVDLDPSDGTRREFGALTWLGTLSLTTSAPAFGGFSGLALDATGTKLWAVSDAGFWLTADLATSGDAITGVASARIGPLLGADGKARGGDRNIDAEALALRGQGDGFEALVGFERDHHIAVFSANGRGLGRLKRRLKLPAAVRGLPANKGLEAVTILSDGGLLLISERGLTNAGHHRGWLIGRGKSREIAIERLKEFDITDAAGLPDGGAVILERRYRPSEGVQFRLRRIPAKELGKGALIRGLVLFEGDFSLGIDNMEGLAVHQNADGRTLVTLISDDNFSFFQRTLVMRFALPASAVVPAAKPGASARASVPPLPAKR